MFAYTGGLQGIQGVKGDAGDQGIQGVKGDAGDQGIQGVKGDKGDTGDTGAAGYFASKFLARLTPTAQTVATATWVQVLFNTVDYDTLSEYDHAGTHNWVADANGFYHFDTTLFIESPGTTNPVEVMFRVNGSSLWLASDSRQGVATVSHNRITFGCDMSLSPNEYVSVWLHHYKGSNADIKVASVFSGHRFA